MSSDARPKVSLREMAEEAHRELALRHRVYPGQVKRGFLTQADADTFIARMRAIRDTLRLFAEHEDSVRAALAFSMQRTREAAEIDALQEHEAVAAVREAFPGAEITAVRDLPPDDLTDPDPDSTERETEAA